MRRKRKRLLSEEVLYYLHDDWEDSIGEFGDGVWLTTRAVQLNLRKRGILTTWPTLNSRLMELFEDGELEKINTSNGICWKPKDK